MKKHIYRILLASILFSVAPMHASETVYLLHGFMRSASSMKKASKALNKVGFETILWDYPSRKKKIEEHAQDLVKELRKTAKKNPGEPIHFFTHSMGGIVVRSAINHPKCPHEARIGKAVLLAPPNKGSRYAHFLNYIRPVKKLVGKKSGKELFRTSDFDHLGNFPSTMQVMVISGTFGWNPVLKGKNDGKVTYKESQLDTPYKHKKVFAGHSWIMKSKKAIEKGVDFMLQD